MVFNQLLRRHTIDVTELGFDHYWHMTQGLFDGTFGNSID